MNHFLKQLFILLVLAVLSVQAQAQSKIIRYTEKGDTLELVAQRYLPSMISKYGNNVEDFKSDLVKWNPHISNWNKLTPETPFYLAYPYPPFLPGPYGADLLFIQPPKKTQETESRFKNFIFYMASLGHFSEQTAGNQTIKSIQNSPVSLGIGTLFKMQDRQSLAASFYWSKLVTSNIEGQVANSESKISVPNEYGMNLYFQQRIAETSFTVYTGIDYEKFATYNTAELVPGSLLQTRTNNLSYVTAGLSKSFSFFGGLNLNSKLSLAQSVMSKSSTGKSSDKFKGKRFLLFASLKKKGPFAFQFLYKHHSLTGPTELSIDRFGLGLSYEF